MVARRWLAFALAGVAIVLVAGRICASLYVDYQWYAVMGAVSVWRAKLENDLILRGLSVLAGSIFLFANLYAVRGAVASIRLPRRLGDLDISEEVPARYIALSAAGFAVLLAALLTILPASWTTLALARYGVPFAETDPYFQLDLGHFVYWLPLEISLYFWALVALPLAIVVVTALYVITRALRWERGRLLASAHVRRHITVFGALVLLVLAWSYRLDAYGLLTNGSGPDYAFTSIDHQVIIPANLALIVITCAASVLVLVAGWRGQTRLASGTVAAVIALSLVLRQLLPLAIRHTGGRATAAREAPYLSTRGGYTRRAYDVAHIVRADSTFGFAGPAAIAVGVPTWDAGALERLAERSRTPSVAEGVGWTATPTGVLASVVTRAADDSVVRNRLIEDRLLASATDPRGGLAAEEQTRVLPTLIGNESGPGYKIVIDSAGALPAASVEDFWSRLAHAWSEQNFRLLSDAPGPNAKIVLYRGVRERVAAIAPFFAQGSVVTPLVARDSLFWALDLYSASDTYPLSAHLRLAGGEWSYFQHAAVAIVYAATGRVRIAADSILDPIADTWVRRFPELFVPRASLEPALAEALPPAVDGTIARAVSFARYDGRGDRSEAWHAALADGSDTTAAGRAPAVMFLPQRGVAFTLALVDPSERVRGVVAGVGGRMPATVWDSLEVPGPRWSEVLERLRREPDSTPVATQTGAAAGDARVTQGRTRVVPVAGRVAFVQSAYIWRADGAPALARVTLLLSDSARTGRSLAEVVGGPHEGASPATRPADFRGRVSALYAAMRAALRRGDWVAFGAAYDSLGRVVNAHPR